MTTTASPRPRRETLNLRIPTAERNLIDRAAKSAGKTRTDFILEAARRVAEETLLDRALMVVSPKAYAEFLKRRARPADPNERLRRTMQANRPGTRLARMMRAPEPPNPEHVIAGFDCGVSSLNALLQRRALANQVSGAPR